MFVFRALAAFAFAALLMGRFSLDGAPLDGLRAELAAAQPRTRLKSQLSTLFRNETDRFDAAPRR